MCEHPHPHPSSSHPLSPLLPVCLALSSTAAADEKIPARAGEWAQCVKALVGEDDGRIEWASESCADTYTSRTCSDEIKQMAQAKPGEVATPGIPAPGRQKTEDQELQADVSNRARTCIKNKTSRQVRLA